MTSQAVAATVNKAPKPTTLEDVAKGSVRSIPVDSIMADSTTQTRMTALGTQGEQEHAARQSRLVVSDIAQSAKSDKEFELPNPIMVAEVDGRRKLIDGHHRLEGFKKAGRKKIRAYVIKTSEADWKRLAIQANSVSQIVPESRAERLEKAWQLVKVGHDGERWISPSDNNSRTATRHQVTRKTVIKMVDTRKKLRSDDDLSNMTWAEAQARISEYEDREFDEGKEREPAEHAAAIAQDLIETGRIASMVEGGWLLTALYHLITDNNVPYGLSPEELVEYIRAHHSGTGIGFTDPLIETEDRF
ncbi:MAG: ParB/RepB/Spo0J family partition protein [Motiliproteus sp.]